MVTMIRSDLDFILAQIKIAEADAQNIDIVATGLVPNSEIPWGLRRVDGSNNNLVPGQEHFGSADQPFPRGNSQTFINEQDETPFFGVTNTNYGVRGTPGSNVVDSDPRIISNLIVDQTANNHAAVYRALEQAERPNPFPTCCWSRRPCRT